jgi:hypothetical protein
MKNERSASRPGRLSSEEWAPGTNGYEAGWILPVWMVVEKGKTSRIV